MALLTQKELQTKGRVEIVLNKMTSKIPFTTKDGKQRILTKVQITNAQGKIIVYDPLKRADYTTLLSYLKSSSLKMDAVLLRNEKEGSQVALSELVKTEDLGGQRKGNKGDMAEAIFAAAITAKFINKLNDVSEQDIKLIINQLDPNKVTQSFAYSSKNKNTQVTDTIIYELNLSQSNLKALTNPLTWNTLGSIIDGSLKYANADNIKMLAKTMYENNRKNTIKVSAVGINQQKTTKVDVKVEIDGKPVVLTSLKTNDIKQFGQVGGASFENQVELWTTLLGINPSEAKAKYDLAVRDGDYMAGLAQIYRQVETEFNQRASQIASRSGLYSDLAEGIKYFATRKEKSVEMVSLNKKEIKIYEFDNLNTLMSLDQSNRLMAKYNPTSYPKLDIMDTKNRKVLLSVRVRRDKEYVRNVVEKGKLMDEFSRSIML